MDFEAWKMQFRHRVALIAGVKKECFDETLHMIPHDDVLIEMWSEGELPNDAADNEMTDWDE